MGWRVGSCWALIGFAAQCFAALIEGTDLSSGLKMALVHYVAWGVAGFLVGSFVEGVISDSFRAQVAREQAERKQTTETPTS